MNYNLNKVAWVSFGPLQQFKMEFRKSKCLILAKNGYYCFEMGAFGFVPKSSNSCKMDPFLS